MRVLPIRMARLLLPTLTARQVITMPGTTNPNKRAVGKIASVAAANSTARPEGVAAAVDPTLRVNKTQAIRITAECGSRALEEAVASLAAAEKPTPKAIDNIKVVDRTPLLETIQITTTTRHPATVTATIAVAASITKSLEDSDSNRAVRKVAPVATMGEPAWAHSASKDPMVQMADLVN